MQPLDFARLFCCCFLVLGSLLTESLMLAGYGENLDKGSGALVICVNEAGGDHE